ncbi:hypothetical protein HGB13_01690 [bacterium]|nr:hypothetical protein [bacterium]
MKKILLEQSGLTKSEALVYETLLEHGELSPPLTALHTGLSRENAYNVLNSLLAKELAEIAPRKKKKMFRPAPPVKLKELIENEKRIIDERQKAIDAIVPTLNNLYNLSSNKPSVSYFEGIEGIKKVYEDSLREQPEETLVFRSIYDDEAMDKYLHDWMKRRAKRGIKNRIINPKGYFIGGAGTDKELNRKSLHIDPKFFSLPTEITVYNNKVSILSLRKDKIGIIIESSDFAETFKNIFEYIWKKEK